jgi:hypothetical protein
MTAAYLLALLLTLAIEIPVVALVFAGQRLRMALVCLVATTATHLLMHFVLPSVCPTARSWLIAGEAQALVLEALAYLLLSRPRDPGRALIASALANSASFAAGLALAG